MDLSQYVSLGIVLIGANEVLVRLRAKDYWVVTTILTGVVIGALAGALQVFEVPSVEVGVLVALGASGGLKGLSILGNKSTPAPSTPLEKAQ